MINEYHLRNLCEVLGMKIKCLLCIDTKKIINE